MKHLLYTAPVRQLFGFALLLLLVSQIAISLFAWSAIEEKIRPELDRKARAVGTSITNKIVRALDYGIPFQRLEGVDEFFNDVLKENEDLAFLAMTSPEGQVLFASGADREQIGNALARLGSRTELSTGRTISVKVSVHHSGRDQKNFLDTPVLIRHQGQAVGILHVGVDQAFISSKISDLRYDVGIILLTSMLIAFEILLFVVSLNFSGPMRQIAELMTRMAAGDFSHRAAMTVKEQLGSLAERLNQLAARVNHAFAQAVHTISDAAAANPEAKPFSAAILARLRTHYVFAEGGAMRDLVQQRIVSIRILTFLFMFAEMLSRPFLPLYTGSLPDPGLGLPPDLMASLPITAYLLGVACTMPLAGRWSDRMGRRASYVTGAAIVMLGLLATGMIPDFIVVLLARTITGIGYAMMYMSCQGYVIDNTDHSNRSRGMALFVGAIMVSEICAPAVGGILADRIGYRLVFVFGALIAVVAAALATRILDNHGAKARAPGDTTAGQLAGLVKNHRFMALSILAGIPAKLLLSGFLIYLVPVILSGLDSSKSEIGRYAMIYGIVAVALTPVFARITDRYRIYGPMVGIGGILTGAGLLPILSGATADNVILGIAALGLGQSMSISAQLVLVTEVTRKEAQVAGTNTILGVFRLIERLGGAAGPAVTGMLVSCYGTSCAMAALGAFGAISSALFLIIFFISGTESDTDSAAKLKAEGASA